MMRWTAPTSRNRRLERNRVLEVKARTRGRRAARLRLVAAALSIAVGTLGVLLLLWRSGEWALDRLVFANPAFGIRHLEIETDGLIPAETIRRWTGIRPGDNLLALDLGRLQRDLELVPLVRSAALLRVPPDTLKIRIVGRWPVAEVRAAQLRSAGGIDVVSYYLDAAGMVIRFAPEVLPELAREMAEDPPPRLAGVEVGGLRAGRALEVPVVRAALRLVEAFDQSPMADRERIESVDVSQPDAVELTTASGMRVVFGLNDPSCALDRWRLVLEYAQQQGKVISTLDLSVTNNVPAVFLDAAVASPEPPPHRKPSRLRKRHA